MSLSSAFRWKGYKHKDSEFKILSKQVGARDFVQFNHMKRVLIIYINANHVVTSI